MSQGKSRVSDDPFLIVEDDVVVSLDLEYIVARRFHGPVVAVSSVAQARARVSGPIRAALLDIDVRDGTTLALAEDLRLRGVPFAFVSGSEPGSLPARLRHIPFVSKPYAPDAVTRALGEILRAPVTS